MRYRLYRYSAFDGGKLYVAQEGGVTPFKNLAKVYASHEEATKDRNEREARMPTQTFYYEEVPDV